MGLFINLLFVLFGVLYLISDQGVGGSTFTFLNKCDFTVWPGILGTPTLASTGFELPKSGSRSIQVPMGWSGRFWARTGCNFNGLGHGSCSTGDCGSGQIECGGSGAAPPATLAEFTLGSGAHDFYDVSLVDGYNLPMMVEPSGGSGQCGLTGCVVDLNLRCPVELRAASGGACRSACEAFGTPEYCCSGAYGSPDTCVPSVYSQMFKNACPRSYSYAYDDATSTFTCTGADYAVTFCPSIPSQKNLNDSAKSSPTVDGTVSETESGEDMVLANGSWLADLATATGDSTTTHPSLVFLQFVLLFFTLFLHF